jgi:hypothetical protein
MLMCSYQTLQVDYSQALVYHMDARHDSGWDNGHFIAFGGHMVFHPH